MASATYDPKDVAVIVDGTYLTGFSEDMVEIEKTENNFEAKVGAQGDVVRTKVNNPLGTIKVTLLPSSPQVAYLDLLANTGRLVPVTVIYAGTPKETTTVTEAYVNKPATRTYGNEAADREYEIQCLDLEMN
ncbi:phage structural protein [Brevibacillus nitrificans]|uniref:phage structural protein n=1 Tax=Brevibacillus nitrificans TaxID=651560 RepID=UPI0026301ED4|nr:phage protein [Brevibacillus nitrificans]